MTAMTRMPYRAPLAATALACLAAGCAQEAPDDNTADVPDTDIFLARTRIDGQDLSLDEPVNVTRREGYDNQPSFLADGSGFLYTVIRRDQQADIWHYDIPSRSRRRVTKSLESEFSPAVVPDGEGFSTVRAEPDGLIRLWRFAMDGQSPRVVLRDITGVAFYAWVDPRTLALAMAREGGQFMLELVDLASGTETVVARNIGRCLHRVPGGRRVAYVDKTTEQHWQIRILDLNSEAFVRSIPARAGAEDFVVLPDGSIVMAEGRRLFVHRPDGAEWRLLADWSDRLDGRITRLAASPDGSHLAVVVGAS